MAFQQVYDACINVILDMLWTGMVLILENQLL